jgi:hypothetical protein
MASLYTVSFVFSQPGEQILEYRVTLTGNELTAMAKALLIRQFSPPPSRGLFTINPTSLSDRSVIPLTGET